MAVALRANPSPELVENPNEPIHLQLTLESKQYLRDCEWVNEQFDIDGWAQCRGEYIAVLEMQILGHGPDPSALRERRAASQNVRPGRIVIAFIEPPIEC